MEITEKQYQEVTYLFPVQRGNVKLSNLQVLNAVLYLAEAASGRVCRNALGCSGVHVLSADDRTALAVALSPGQAHDGV